MLVCVAAAAAAVAVRLADERFKEQRSSGSCSGLCPTVGRSVFDRLEYMA